MDGRGMKRAVRTLLAALVLAQGAPCRADDDSPIGNNVAAHLAYFSPEIVFVDMMKGAGPFIIGYDSNGVLIRPSDVDADGWVRSLPLGQDVTTTIHQSRRPGAYPSGQYVCLYEGEGTFSFLGAGISVVSQTPGRMVLDVDSTVPDASIVLQISQTNPANYLRNIRLIMPGHEATYQTQPYFPRFLSAVAPYSVIRFLLWMWHGPALDDRNYEWSERHPGNYFSQGAPNPEVSLETMIDLANALHQHPWFTMPQYPTDDYVRQFARMVRDRLDPSLNAYIEFSNELWNSAYGAHHDAGRAGCAEGLNLIGFNTGEVCDGGPMYFAALKWQARHSGRIFRIFDEEFGPAGRNRYIKVLGTHISPYLTQFVVDAFYDPAINTYGGQADAVAVAPYFGFPLTMPEQHPEVPTMTVDQVLDFCEAHIRDELGPLMNQVSAVARARGLKMLAYEGGHILDATSAWGDQRSTVRALFRAAADHPRMGTILTDYFTRWRAAGGELFVHFKNVEGFAGALGIFESGNVDPAELMNMPRWAAIVNYSAANPVWWDWDPPPQDGMPPARPRNLRVRP